MISKAECGEGTKVTSPQEPWVRPLAQKCAFLLVWRCRQNLLLSQATSQGFVWPKSPVSYQGWRNTLFGKETKHIMHKFYTRPSYDVHLVYGRTLCDKKTSQNCMFWENSTVLQRRVNSASQSLQPERSKLCAMVILFNLMQPDWISAHCDEKYLSHLVCFAKNMTKQNQSLSQSKRLPSHHLFCERNQILHQTQCYFFLWFNGDKTKPTFAHKSCTDIKQLAFEVRKTETDSVFHTVVDATNIGIFVAISFSSLNAENFKALEFSKRKQKTSVEESGQTQGMFACSSSGITQIDVPEQLFKCANSKYISTLLVCDGVTDCSADNKQFGDDEKNILCSGRQLIQKFLFYLTKHGKQTTFTKYIGQLEDDPLDNRLGAVFVCAEGRTQVSNQSLNDLVSDCSLGDQDEYEYKDLLTRSSFQSCPHPHQLPCVPGHSQCYNISHICIYRVTVQGKHLFPCRTGSHIQNCKNFKCNANFKCPNYYCVPWQYKCDGKWDCPDGLDETKSCQLWNCSGLFRCSNSTACIHINDVCDQSSDCVLEDDEALCSLNTFKCPEVCVCLNLAVSCVDTDLSVYKHRAWPHVSFYLVNCGVFSWFDFQFSSHLLAANLSRNLISQMFLSPRVCPHLFSLDLSQNKFTRLEENTFVDLRHLIDIQLSRNLIKQVDSGAFSNLSSLQNLDLQDNSIVSFGSEIFSATHLIVLNIKNNPISDIEKFPPKVEICDIVITDTFKACCAQMHTKFCSAFVHSKCQRLIPNAALSYIFLIVFFCVTLSNLFCIYHMKKTVVSSSSGAMKKTCEQIFCSINCMHLWVGFYTGGTWIVDQYFGHVYYLHDESWRKHVVCHVTFVACLFWSVLNPEMLCFLSVSRWDVVIQPFNSKFKSHKFVKKSLTVLTLVTFAVFVSSSTALLFYFPVTSGICLPFLDLSSSWLHIKVVTLVILTVQATSLTVTCLADISLIRAWTKSGEALLGVQTSKRNTVIQLAVLFVADCLTWLPASVIFIIFLFTPQDSKNIVLFAIAIFFPINAIVNPVVFRVSSKK